MQFIYLIGFMSKIEIQNYYSFFSNGICIQYLKQIFIMLVSFSFAFLFVTRKIISPNIPQVALYVYACYAKFWWLHPPLNNGGERECCHQSKLNLSWQRNQKVLEIYNKIRISITKFEDFLDVFAVNFWFICSVYTYLKNKSF